MTLWQLSVWLVKKAVHNTYTRHVDGLVQERRNSSALAIELCLCCPNTSMFWFWADDPIYADLSLRWGTMMNTNSNDGNDSGFKNKQHQIYKNNVQVFFKCNKNHETVTVVGARQSTIKVLARRWLSKLNMIATCISAWGVNISSINYICI